MINKKIIIFSLLFLFSGIQFLLAGDRGNETKNQSTDVRANRQKKQSYKKEPARDEKDNQINDSNSMIILGGFISIGKVLSVHILSNPDDDVINNKMYSMFTIFGEWYFWQGLGVGIRIFSLSTYPYFPSMEVVDHEDDIISNLFYTLQWAPFYIDASSKKLHVGFLAGYSPDSFFVRKELSPSGKEKEEQNLGLLEEDFTVKEANGFAFLYESYAEYKLRAHGFRFSLYYLETHFSKFKGSNVKPDGSGYGYYLTYSYGFSL